MSIGETFRERRSARGLSVEQAAAQSKVPLRIVQALESDDYRTLPDPMYVIRHLRDYAILLEVDPEVAEVGFHAVSAHQPAVPVPASAPRLPLHIAWKQVFWTIGVLLLITPLVFIALSLASKRAADREAERAQTAAEEAPAAISTLLPDRSLRDDAVALTPTPAVLAGAPGAAAPRAAPASTAVLPAGTAHVLVVHAREATWMSVRADRGERQQVLLQPGETTQFKAEERLHLIVGNAGGVSLTFDGTPLPSLGASGAVIRDLILPPIPGGPVPLPVRSPGQP